MCEEKVEQLQIVVANSYEIKRNVLMYKMCRPFGEGRRRKCENIQFKQLSTLK